MTIKKYKLTPNYINCIMRMFDSLSKIVTLWYIGINKDDVDKDFAELEI